MSTDRFGTIRPDQRTDTGRPVDLVGDSAELVAFALLRNVVQMEQKNSTDLKLDRKWLLNAYAECLRAVRGERALTADSTTAPVNKQVARKDRAHLERRK